MLEKMTLARPYAKAIFTLATQKKQQSQWLQTLQIFAEISESPKMQRLIRDSSLPPESIASGFEEIFPLPLDQEGKNLLNLLALKKRLWVLPQIAVYYEKLCDEANQILPVEFMSVISLTDRQKKEFSDSLSKRFKKVIQMETKIDPSLIAGFWIRAGDQVIDGSIRGHLEQLKASMGE